MHGAAVGADQHVAFTQCGDQFGQRLRWSDDHRSAGAVRVDTALHNSFHYFPCLGVVARMQRVVFRARRPQQHEARRVMSDVLINGANQFRHAGEHAATNPFGDDVAEESTMLSHDAEVGVKCMVKRGCLANHSCTAGCLCVA